jgi:hypothetical protein
VRKYVEFTHVTQRSWEKNAETIVKKIDTLQTSGYKVISVSFSSAMVACIFYRKTIWKAIKDSFNIPYWE